MGLKTEYSVMDDWFYAYDGDTLETSDYRGQGSTPEKARADYWGNKNPTADIAKLWQYGDRWQLTGSNTDMMFNTKEEAIAYADKNDWVI